MASETTAAKEAAARAMTGADEAKKVAMQVATETAKALAHLDKQQQKLAAGGGLDLYGDDSKRACVAAARTGRRAPTTQRDGLAQSPRAAE